MNYNINEQALAFDRVLPYEGQIECFVQKNGKNYLQIMAPNANTVVFRYQEVDHECTKDANGVWSTEYTATTAMNYVQLKIDGVELITPILPISYGYNRPYNYVALETGEDFYAVKDVPHGSVRKEYYFSKVTGEWECCTVYTPARYDINTDETFPVLYLQHGRGENEASWTTAGKVNFIMDNLIAEGKVVPFAVVMGNGMVQTINEAGERVVDFELFENQLIEDIIPFVEGKLRLGGSKEKRAMAGLSMGSLQTCIIGFKHPELFSSLGVFSGFVSNIITGSELDQIKREPKKDAHFGILEDSKNFAKQFQVFFRAMGDEDPYFETFLGDDKILEEKGIKGLRTVYKGTHDWNVWRQCIRDFAQLIFR